MIRGRHAVFRTSSCIVVLLVSANVYAQRPNRTSIVINEISPVSECVTAPDSECRSAPWIEFFNPSERRVPLAGLVVRGDDEELYTIPDDCRDLAPKGYVLVTFSDYYEGREINAIPPDSSGRLAARLITVRRPRNEADTWIPARGELSLFEPRGHAPPKFIDHVAWGDSENPRAVQLTEGFGVTSRTPTLKAGESIGLYPVETGTPEHWVIYSNHDDCELDDPDRRRPELCEVTPGLPNAIPRPKAFTPRSGATHNANAVALGWARRPGDRSYRIDLARDTDFEDMVFSLPVPSPSIRLGWSLEPGQYFVRVFAQYARTLSAPSDTYTLTVDDSKCGNLPIMAFAYPDFDMTPPATWCTELAPDECEVLGSIEFKYQRKDSRMFCPLCKTDWRNMPHRLCMTFILNESEWESEWPGDSGSFMPYQHCLSSDHRISRSCNRDGPQRLDMGRTEKHGTQYCVPASVSMIASAYGKCLSQDRIAYQIHSDRQNSTAAGDLGHNKSAFCGGIGEDCTATLKWALGLTPGTPNQALFQTRDQASDPVEFNQIKGWIDGHRPVMVASEGHASVVAGYCVDDESEETRVEWLFVYDPIAGPLMVKAAEVIDSAIKFWATQPVDDTDDFDSAQLMASKHVRGDESGLWSDWDGDGIVDFDEALRFATSPFCQKASSPEAESDWDTSGEWATTGESPADSWKSWDPWMVCH